MHWCSSSASVSRSSSLSPSMSLVRTSVSASRGRARRFATSVRRYAAMSRTARLPALARSGVSTGSSAPRIASDHARNGSRSSCGTPSRLPMISTGMAPAIVIDQVDRPPCGQTVEQAIHERDQARLHRGDVPLRQRADDRAPHAGVQRRIVEDEARRMVLEERRRAVLRTEFEFLVRAPQLRIAVDRNDVVVAGQEPGAVRHSLDRRAFPQRAVVRIRIRVIIVGQMREIELRGALGVVHLPWPRSTRRRRTRPFRTGLSRTRDRS